MVQLYFHALTYCDFYGKSTDCCRRFPCERPNIHFSKNHDHAADLSPAPGVAHLVQYRDFLPAVVSEWELALTTGIEDNRATFRLFALDREVAWSAFMAKWVEAPADNWDRLAVQYETLTANPDAELRKIVKFFAPSAPVSDEHIERTLADVSAQSVTKGVEMWQEKAGVKNRRRIEDFRHYDAGLFSEIADKVRR